jgi:hypothetical protein
MVTAKQLINPKSGFPTVDEWLVTWNAFQEGLQQPSVQARLLTLKKAGLQVNVTLERDMTEELLRFVGDGSFDV